MTQATSKPTLVINIRQLTTAEIITLQAMADCIHPINGNREPLPISHKPKHKWQWEVYVSRSTMKSLIDKGLSVYRNLDGDDEYKSLEITQLGLDVIGMGDLVDQPQPAPTLSPTLTDAESTASAEQHARSISTATGKPTNILCPEPVHQMSRHQWDVLAHKLFTTGWEFSKDTPTSCPCCGKSATLGKATYNPDTYEFQMGKRNRVRKFVVCEVGVTGIADDTTSTAIPHAIEATASAYIEALGAGELTTETLDEIAFHQAGVEMAQREQLEAEETTPAPALSRPNAPVSGGQINAINVLITRHCVGHKREWFYHFTKSVIGRNVSNPGGLTASEAQQIEMAIQHIARKRCYPGDLMSADMDLDFTLKFDCFPEDWERAKAEIAEVTREATLEVSKMRTSNPRYLTKAEAICYSTKLFKVAETYRKYAADTVTVQG